MRVYTMLLSTAMNTHNDTLFTFPYDMPEEYKPIFEHRFLLRFGYRNIGFDSYAMFKRMLELSLSELLPKYLKLYESENVCINPFVNTQIKNSNFTRNKGRRKDYETANSKNSNYNNSANTNVDVSTGGTTGGFNENTLSSRQTLDKQRGINDSGSTKLNLFADTPQTQAQTEGEAGGGSGSSTRESDKYFNDGFITTASKDSDSATAISSSSANGYAQDATERGNNTYTTQGSESSTVGQSKGVGGGQSYADREVVAANQQTQFGDSETVGLDGVLMSEALIEWRKTFINIDQMFFDDLDDLFIGVF